MVMKVAIYARVSTDGQSVNAQLADLREAAERRGWEIVHEYTDTGWAIYRRQASGSICTSKDWTRQRQVAVRCSAC